MTPARRAGRPVAHERSARAQTVSAIGRTINLLCSGHPAPASSAGCAGLGRWLLRGKRARWGHFKRAVHGGASASVHTEVLQSRLRNSERAVAALIG
jgi:hypothetical protein